MGAPQPPRDTHLRSRSCWAVRTRRRQTRQQPPAAQTGPPLVQLVTQTLSPSPVRTHPCPLQRQQRHRTRSHRPPAVQTTHHQTQLRVLLPLQPVQTCHQRRRPPPALLPLRSTRTCHRWLLPVGRTGQVRVLLLVLPLPAQTGLRVLLLLERARGRRRRRRLAGRRGPVRRRGLRRVQRRCWLAGVALGGGG